MSQADNFASASAYAQSLHFAFTALFYYKPLRIDWNLLKMEVELHQRCFKLLRNLRYLFAAETNCNRRVNKGNLAVLNFSTVGVSFKFNQLSFQSTFVQLQLINIHLGMKNKSKLTSHPEEIVRITISLIANYSMSDFNAAQWESIEHT